MRARLLILEVTTQTAILEGQRIELPTREFEVLSVLASKPAEPVTGRELIEKAWPGSAWMTTQDLYWHIWRLRKLIGDGDRDTKLIVNRRGVGYLLNLQPDVVEVVEEGTVAPGDLGAGDEESRDEREPDTDEVDRPVPLEVDEQIPAASANQPLFAPRRRLPTSAVAAAVVTLALLGLSWAAGYLLASRGGDQVAQQSPTEHNTPKGSPEAGPVQRESKEKDAPKQTERRSGQRDPAEKPGDGRSGAIVVAGGGDSISGDEPREQSGSVSSNDQPARSGDDQYKAPVDGDPKPRDKDENEPAPPPQPEANLYHLFDPESGDHFVTTSSSAANKKQAAGYRLSNEGQVFTSETAGTVAIGLSDGTAFIYGSPEAAPAGSNVAALYRLSGQGETFYTTSSSEANQAQAQGWSRSTVGYVGA